MVHRKKQRSTRFHERLDIAGANDENVKDSVSFYFSDFPVTHGAREMLRAFALYGKVMEVVIPSKRNKWGKRFGFARFADLSNPRLFAVKLDNIIFGSNKIHVNLPRFERESKGTKRWEYEEAPKKDTRKVWKEVEGVNGRGKVAGEVPGSKVVNIGGDNEKMEGKKTKHTKKGSSKEEDGSTGNPIRRSCISGKKTFVMCGTMLQKKSWISLRRCTLEW